MCKILLKYRRVRRNYPWSVLFYKLVQFQNISTQISSCVNSDGYSSIGSRLFSTNSGFPP